MISACFPFIRILDCPSSEHISLIANNRVSVKLIISVIFELALSRPALAERGFFEALSSRVALLLNSNYPA